MSVCPEAAARDTGATPDPRTALVTPLAVFAVLRALSFVLVRYGTLLVPPSRRYGSVLPPTDPLARLGPWARPWFRFDARWYVDVAEHGYHLTTQAASNTNFFPLYPLLVRLVQPVALGSPWVAGWLLANLASAASVVVIWIWAVGRWDREVALRTILLMLAFPFSLFFAAPYAESLFVALAAATFLFADRRHWAWASAAAGLCGITRPVGLAVIAGLVVYAWWRAGRKEVGISALSIIPFLAFVVYLWLSVGDPIAFTIYHSAGWVPPHGGILTTVASQFRTGLSPFDRIDAVVAVLFLGSAILVWQKMGPGYAVFVALGVLLPLIHGLVSMERYVIVLYPVFAAWSLIPSRWVPPVIFALSLFLLVPAAALFSGGYALF